jgi:hypothetical protein
MHRGETEHRDQILRAYFNGRNWDKNNEYFLKRELVLNSHKLLPNYPFVIEDEWEAESSRTDKGRGDLVFTDAIGSFAIVEVKWIDLEGVGRIGSTKRTSNRKKRRTVEQQAVHYATIYAELALKRLDIVKRVEAFIFTNEFPQPVLITNG